MRRSSLSVVFAAAECAPFAKVGGLGDVIGSLPQALAERGVNVAVILPKYGSIPVSYQLRKLPHAVVCNHHNRTETCDIYQASLPNNSVTYYFIAHPYFNDPAIYLPHDITRNAAGATNIDRFSLFSLAVVEAINQLKIPADILHCHDWHTGLIPSYIDQLATTKGYPFTPTIYTIHNLASQGMIDRSALPSLGLRPEADPSLLEDYYDLDNEHINCMKIGILSADRVTTVSPTYAREILKPEYGAGLHTFLARRRKHLTGILNGIDTILFNPRNDHYISEPYDTNNVQEIKSVNRYFLQREMGLEERDVPVYGLVSRVVAQKGFDILLKVLPTFLKRDVQMVILGSGDSSIEQQLQTLSRMHADKLVVRAEFNLELAQKIYAGSDCFVMPSRFEPCGLGQMIAMRYGTLPLVRATGGLKDTVEDARNGFVFKQYTAAALLRALERSRKLFEDEQAWYTMVRQAMQEDFSWHVSARTYEALYQKIA